MKSNFLHIVIFCIITTFSSLAQNRIETSVDTTSIKLGDTFLYTIKAHTKAGTLVTFPATEQLGNFDVVESFPIDTISNDNTLELIKKYHLTQFDAGDFSVPSIPVIVDSKLFHTDSIKINVQDIEVDTIKKPLFEIKNISKEGASFSTYWYYILFIVFAIILGIGMYWYIKKQQEKNLTEDDKYKTPFEKAVKKLKKLEEKKNWNRGDAKPYYSDMSIITRNFIEETFGISAKELTTFEIITILKATLNDKEIKLDPNIIKDLKRVLEAADLVKFAKSQPTEGEITADTSKIQHIVNGINIAYPISAATQTELIRLREERKKKKKRVRIWIPTIVTSVLVIITGIIYLVNVTSEEDYHWLTFNNTKKLLNKEWVTSEYGTSPGITVSTPEVLIRKNEPILEQTKPDGITSLNQFKFGVLEDPIHIVVNNVVTTEEFKYSQKELITYSISILTQNNKTDNLEYKDEEFENANGITGTKVKGSFSFKNSENKKEENISFQGVITGHGYNKDQVWVFYLTEDTNAGALVERIFDSILYKQEQK
ncbi:BatD family protein [Myroides sp. M-43]|uniref:BatD family protein n=1 Tax=Myroides oncorhynchi TaxID=2893756 RepID=UPI001E62ECBF|nr:BatD family protein [Myroides oncorhynchi]MCC9042067.1 BatD family protein [Myroides oncorhynchi]